METRYRVSLSAFALALGFLAATPATAQTIQSTFDSGLDGWTAFGITTSWQSTGGNPGGFIRGDDEPFTSYLLAPAAFLGDLSAFNGGQLSFDHIVLDTQGNPIEGLGGTVEIFSGIQSASADLLTPSLTWQTGSVSLTAAAWSVSQATWTSILSNVTEIRVVIDSTFGDNSDGFDNFTIVAPEPPPAVPVLGPAAGSILTLLILASGIIVTRQEKTTATCCPPSRIWTPPTS